MFKIKGTIKNIRFIGGDLVYAYSIELEGYKTLKDWACDCVFIPNLYSESLNFQIDNGRPKIYSSFPEQIKCFNIEKILFESEDDSYLEYGEDQEFDIDIEVILVPAGNSDPYRSIPNWIN